MHVHFCKFPIENNVKNKEVKTTMMQVLKAKNLCRCTVIKVPNPKREGGPVLLLQNYPHPLSLRGRVPYHFPTLLNT